MASHAAGESTPSAKPKVDRRQAKFGRESMRFGHDSLSFWGKFAFLQRFLSERVGNSGLNVPIDFYCSCAKIEMLHCNIVASTHPIETVMINTPEQFVQAQKTSFDMFQAVALKSLEGFEKLAELNMQAFKASIEESTEQMKTLMSAKDVKAFGNFSMAAAQPAADKAGAYAKHVYDITSETSSEIAKLVEKQFAEGNKQFTATIDAMAKNAPAGTEGIVTLVKQAVSAANSAYDQVNKATKHAVEAAEANMAAAAKSVRPAAKKAA